MNLLKQNLLELLEEYDRTKGLQTWDQEHIRLLRNFVNTQLRDLEPKAPLSSERLAELLIIVYGHADYKYYTHKSPSKILFTQLETLIKALPELSLYSKNIPHPGFLPALLRSLKKQGLLKTYAGRLLSAPFTSTESTKLVGQIVHIMDQAKLLDAHLEHLMTHAITPMMIDGPSAESFIKVCFIRYLISLLSKFPKLLAIYAEAIITNPHKNSRITEVIAILARFNLLETHLGVALANTHNGHHLYEILNEYLPKSLVTADNLRKLLDKASEAAGIKMMLRCGLGDNAWSGNTKITQTFFDQVIQHSDIFNRSIVLDAYATLPYQLFTGKVADHWFEECRAHPGDPETAARKIADDIKRLEARPPGLFMPVHGLLTGETPSPLSTSLTASADQTAPESESTLRSEPVAGHRSAPARSLLGGQSSLFSVKEVILDASPQQRPAIAIPTANLLDDHSFGLGLEEGTEPPPALCAP